MSEKKTEASELDIARLFALKAFERPDPDRVEKEVQKTMNAVRAEHKRPSLNLFPDKSPAWMFAQPRYGIAALFILFLGLHILNMSMPKEVVGPAVLKEPEVDMADIIKTNRVPKVEAPGMAPVYSPVMPKASFKVRDSVRQSR